MKMSKWVTAGELFCEQDVTHLRISIYKKRTVHRLKVTAPSLVSELRVCQKHYMKMSKWVTAGELFCEQDVTHLRISICNKKGQPMGFITIDCPFIFA